MHVATLMIILIIGNLKNSVDTRKIGQLNLKGSEAPHVQSMLANFREAYDRFSFLSYR